MVSEADTKGIRKTDRELTKSEKIANKQLKRYSQVGSKGRSFCSIQRFVVHPEKSKICNYWDAVICPALLFTCLFTPWEVSFVHEETHHITVWIANLGPRQIINICVDIIFLMDLVLQFFLMYPVITARGSMLWINDPSAIALHYIQSWFLIDLVSVIPFDLLLTLVDHGSSNGHSTTHRYRIIKVIRALRLLKLMRVLRASRIAKRWQNDFSISQQKLTMFKFLIILIISGHWMACFWGLIGFLQDASHTWITVEVSKGFVKPEELYVAALHWSIMTLTSIGYGDVVGVTVVERTCGIVAMLFSGCLWANVIGGFSAAATALDQRRMEFNTMMDELNSVMQEHQLPRSMRSRVRHFFYQKHDLGNTPMRLNLLLEQMSPELCREVCMHVNSHWLFSINLFDTCSDRFFVEISTRMKPLVFAPEEYFGDIFVLYILHRGIVSKKAGMRILSTGKAWGVDFALNEAVLLENPQVLTFGFCEVLSLPKSQLNEVCSMFPADHAIVRKHTVSIARSRGILFYCARVRYPEMFININDDKFEEKVKAGIIKPIDTPENRREFRGLQLVAATHIDWIMELRMLRCIPQSILDLYGEQCKMTRTVFQTLNTKLVGPINTYDNENEGNEHLLENITQKFPEHPLPHEVPTEHELQKRVTVIDSKMRALQEEFRDQTHLLTKLLSTANKIAENTKRARSRSIDRTRVMEGKSKTLNRCCVPEDSLLIESLDETPKRPPKKTLNFSAPPRV